MIDFGLNRVRLSIKSIAIIMFFIAMPIILQSQVLNIKNGATIHLSNGATLSVNGGMNINSGAALVHDNSGASNLWFSGKFENYGDYLQNTYGILRFYRNLQDSISGGDQTFQRLWVMKSGISMVSLSPGTDVYINESVRLISANIFNIHRSDLHIEEGANIYPDSVSSYTYDPLVDPFNITKFVMTSGEKDLSGSIIRKLPQISNLPLDINIRFPIGTPLDTANPVVRNYSPSRYVFIADQVTTGNNAYLSMRCIASEHPSVEVEGVSLRKYWKVDYNDIFVQPDGYSVRFNYNDNEVQGAEELYMLCLFYRPFDGPNGTYYINSGFGYGIEPVNNRFYIDEVNRKDTLGGTQLLLDGEWTAGQQEAVSVMYYSIADGDWYDPNTWSKQGYNGDPSPTYPATENDRVFIGNGRTVSVSATTDQVHSIRVQETGRLKFEVYNTTVQGDSLIVEPGGTLAISNDDGISETGMLGNVQSNLRIFSQFGIYEYIGDRKQVTGTGLPDIVASLVVNKDALTDTLSLTKSVLIKDSLAINEGTLHLFRNGNFTAHGETGDTTNRSIIMRGGNFSVQNFPIKYKNAIFNEGTVTFDGTGSFRIPSSQSPGPGEPAVTQYNNVKIIGDRGADTYITLDPTGIIRINGDLDISGLYFDPTPISDRFIVTGSTVAFNGDGDQEIQTGYATPTALVYRMKFHNLNVDGSGNKNIMPPNDSDPNNNFVLVRNIINLNSGTLVSNSHHIKVLNSWITTSGANFDAGNGLVTFEADGKVTNIQSSGIEFNHVNITGTAINGIVNYLDSMTIGGNLRIEPANFRDLNNTALSLRGDFINSGIFTAQTGRVYFNGAISQKIIHNGRGNFYNLAVDKPSDNVLLDGDSLIKVTNNLTLSQGNISGRLSDSVVNKPIVVDGTITRSGANPGHIDGRLRLPTEENANTKLFTVGLGNDYAPVDLEITGWGGAAGYLDAYVLFDTDAPNITTAVIETQVPNGPELDASKNVRKVWVLHADTTRPQRFQLGAARQYNAEFFFVSSDTLGRGNALNFEIYHRDTTINIGRWSRPELDTRNPLSTKFINNNDLDNDASHYFILGEPRVFTYYSIADGNWNEETTWSTAGYLSTEPALRAPISNDNIRIGNGKVVTLTANHAVNGGRSVIVETGGENFENGHLVFGADDILLTHSAPGSSTFILDSGAAITIRHSGGITTGGASGCIRTSNREYNYNNHGMGHFIYGRNGNQSTGNGFPATVRTLQMNMPSGTLTFTGTSPIIQQVVDSLYFARGTANLTPVIMKVGGNFRLGETATFNPGTARNNQPFSLTPPSTASVDTTTLAGGFTLNGGGIQWIVREGNDTIAPIVFNRLSMSKQFGKVISRNNIETPQFIIHPVNRTNFDVQSFNKYLNVYAASGSYNVLRVGRGGGSTGDPGFDSLHVAKYGWVEGRLIRFVASGDGGRIWPIGTTTKYAPVETNRATGSGGVGGLLEIQAIDGNHPDFNPAQINQNTNIQRYYEITRPVGLTPIYEQGNRVLRTRFLFTQDEPRGGIDPATSYFGYRLNSSNEWTRTTNISTESRTASQIWVRVNDPSLGGNNIFQAPSQFTSTESITYMIGEDPTGNERVFYSRNSGDWTDPSTWAYSPVLFENTEDGYAITTNTVNDYPRFNGATRDFAIIGNGDSVYFDASNVDLRYVLLERSPGGMGKLVMPGESYITTDQYVQKNGGKLFIGSRNGITSPATAGNIRRNSTSSIINYDLNDRGINNFVYISDANQVQNTGTGLPATIGSLEIDYAASNQNRYVELTNNANLTIQDSIVFINGRFRNRDDNRTLTIRGDIVNNSNDVGFHNGNDPSNRMVFLTDSLSQTIRGTASETVFSQPVQINKNIGAVVSQKNIRFDDSVQFRSNTRFNLADNTLLTFGEQAVIDSLERFSAQRLFKVSGGANTAKVRKVYPTGTDTYTFTFPIGEDSSGLRSVRYGEARFTLQDMNFVGSNYLEVALRTSYPHPNAYFAAPNTLSKYWNVATDGINLAGGSMSARFKYNDPEVRGNILSYGPALYRRSDVEPNDPGWSFRIFNATNLQIDTTNKYIIVDNAVTLPNHDWTAGEATAFARGKIYWSRANGDWSNPNIWTNYNNSGSPHASDVPALNSPGFFEGDTIIIGSNHLVYYDKTTRFPVDSLEIGVSMSNSPELRFLSTDNSNKSLNVRGSVIIGAEGLISKDNASGQSNDTLYITRIFENTGSAGRGVDFHPNSVRTLRLEFVGNESSFLRGEGNYESIGTVRVFKTDSIYNLHNESQAFSNRFSSAVQSIPTVDFILDAGMYYHDNAANITLSTDGDGNVFLGDLVGLVIRDGNVTYSDGLICGQNASVWLLNGNLTIGNEEDENFQYESVTIIDIQGNSKLIVAGSMRRRFLTSAVDFRLKDNAQIEVMHHGSTTNTSERRAAFDFGEANSVFTMTGGRVTIFRPMDLSLLGEKDPDYFVNTANSVISGGTVQFGHPDSVITGEPFNLIASTPFWNLDLANTYGQDLLIGSPIITVRNDLTVRDNAIWNQNGNTLNIGGDFTIDGQYKTGNIGPRRVSFFGNSVATPATKQLQTVSIKNSTNQPFYDLVINKPNGGEVLLSDDALYPNSNLIIKNTLEFAIGNNCNINTSSSNYVQVGTESADLASIQRFGSGHINGELRRWINNGSQSKLFTVGTANAYTPANIETSAGTGTAGLLSVTAFGIEHPDLVNSDLHQPGTNIDRYWRIVPAGTEPFALGSGRDYTLTLFFRKGQTPLGDQKPGSSFGTFEHFRRTPAWADPIATWHLTVPDSRTDSSTTTKSNAVFGDFVIAEIAGARFYSRQSGNWNDVNTWSISGYSGGVAPRLPNVETDRVFIGNGRSVTINASNPRVRSVTVEQHNGLPGKLTILDERYLRGLSFELSDSCHVATDDAFGFTNVNGPTPNIGAIRTTSIRSYGQSVIEYLGLQSQAMGDGPTNPKTLIINNNGAFDKTVTFSLVNYTVEDSIYVKNGFLSMGQTIINLRGDMVADNSTRLISGASTLNLIGTADQYFVMNDSSGFNLYNLILNKPSGNLMLAGTADSAAVNILNDLRFTATNLANINARLNDKRVVLIDDTSTISRLGLGHIDGRLFKRIPNGSGSYSYPLGIAGQYLPADITVTAGTGVAGYVSGIVYDAPSMQSSRVSPVHKVNYYWHLSPYGDFDIGNRTVNTRFAFPASEISNLSGGVPDNAVILRKSEPALTPLWRQRDYSQLNWNTTQASVEIANSSDYWSGLGEFYIGERFRLVFYSLRDGVWNDNNTWALDEARTILAPEGEYPNPSADDFRDSVVIGWNDSRHNVRLNVANTTISGLSLLYNGRLDLHDEGNMLDNIISSNGIFSLLDSSTISFGGLVNPTTSVLNGFSQYIIGENSTIEFYGTQTITPDPFGLGLYNGNVLINGLGTKFVDSPILILGNLTIGGSATLDVQAIDALSVRKNVTNDANIINRGVIEIGE